MPINWNPFDFLNKKPTEKEMDAIMSKITEQLAFKELALFIGVSYISNAISKCEFKTYEKGKEVQNELYYMLNVSPNPNENSSQFMNKFVEQYYYKGHSLIVPQSDKVYCADDFHLDDTQPLKGYVFDSITFGMQTLRKKYKSNEVFYFKLDNREVKTLIDSLYAQYGEVISQALHSYKRTNSTKYKLLLDNQKAGNGEFNKYFNEVLKKQLESFLESDNGIYPQYKGTSLEEFSSKNPQSTSDIVAMRKEIFEVTAQALKIPLPMMYGNITNMNEIVKVFLSFCIDPLADMISEEITRKNYTYDEWKKGYYVRLDTSCINHVDILEVADKIYNAIGSGIANIDDMRKRLGWNPLDTEFSKQFFVSKNFDKIEDVMNGTTEDSVKGGANNEQT